MTKRLKMLLGRLFSRNPGTYQIIMTVFLLLFVIYEMKQYLNRYQKEKRITFYNNYVNEVYESANKLKESEMKSSNRARELTDVIQILFKLNSSSAES